MKFGHMPFTIIKRKSSLWGLLKQENYSPKCVIGVEKESIVQTEANFSILEVLFECIFLVIPSW